MPLWHLPIWVFGSRPAHCKPEKICAQQRGGKGTSGSEPHADGPPKEEQHGSPSGHLFSQVCSPSVIKIGATHPPSDAALREEEIT
ncbi:hypothetical protein ATANTOWER_001597 [Ataeniobius toweri]|uniref:Uncharacterized protein n=1 Tax=Ataeniobius toweri TaxID=208326 RepID=A0ABU7BDD4_9TELE|nr:hypothetical protein [Ataeniobius toweri]